MLILPKCFSCIAYQRGQMCKCQDYISPDQNTTPSCLLSSTQKRSCCALLLVQCHDTWITFFFGVFLVSGITFIGIIFLCFFLFIIFAILFWNKKKLTDSNLSCLSYRCANNLKNAISGWFSSFYWPVGEVNTYSCLVRANSLIERESCPVWNLYLFQCMNRKQLNTLSLFFLFSQTKLQKLPKAVPRNG